MKVSTNKVAVLGAAVAALFALSAQAVVNLDASPTGAPTYAKEIAGTVTVPNAGNVLDVTAKLGFGLVATQDRFFRFDLTGSAFGAVVTNTMLSNAPTPLGAITVVQGGQIGDSFVIFQVTGGGQLATDTFTFAIPSLKFTSTASNATINYRLFQDAASANGVGGVPITNDGRLLANKTGTLIGFTSAINTTFAPARTEFAAATTNFTRFCDGTGGLPGAAGCTNANTDTLAIVGGIATYALAAGTILDANSVALTNINQVLTAATSTSLTSSATNFQVGGTAGFTAATNNCAALGAGGTVTPAAAPTTLTYATTNATLAGATALCYNVTGTNNIVDQDIIGRFNYVYQTGYAGPATSTPGVVGLIRRDGVELQAPWFTTTPGYISRFALTNTGAVNAACNVITWNAAGAVTPTVPVVTVNAGSQLIVTAADVVPAMPSGPYAVRFVCAAPSGSMQGNYVLTAPNGAVTVGSMKRPGTN
jgi:hypothetical protein